MNWLDASNIPFKRNEPLAKHTTFKIGGPADYFIYPRDNRQLRGILRAARRDRLPVRVIGRGSNILAADEPIKGCVIQLKGAYFAKLAVKGRRVRAGAGCSLSELVRFAAQNNLTGLEFLWGIPGSVGGALVMNAGEGRGGKAMGKFVASATIMEYNGKIRRIHSSAMRFTYRGSSLAKGIVLKAEFLLQKAQPSAIAADIRRYISRRRATPMLKFPNAGCAFRNPSRAASAGKLIEACGLKGLSVGDARVAEEHANYILNLGYASCADVRNLMRLVRDKVKLKFNLVLRPEIKIWR